MHGISQHVAFVDGGGTGRSGGSKMKCVVAPGLPALGRGALAKVSSSFTSLASDKTSVRKRILFLPKKCGKRLLSAMRSLISNEKSKSIYICNWKEMCFRCSSRG